MPDAQPRPTVLRFGAGGSPFVLPDPAGGDPPWRVVQSGEKAGRMAYQRASHLGSVLEDGSGLYRWKEREYLLGAAQLHHDGDPGRVLDSTVDGIIAHIEQARGMSDGALLGTAIHEATDEALANDLAPEDLADIFPEFVAERAAAYLRAVRDAGIVELRSEFEIVNDDLGAVGTADRLYLMPNGDTVIGDLKTSNRLSLSAVKFAAQLATYATGQLYAEHGGARLGPVSPDLNPKYGVIAHVPRGSGAPVTFHRVDLVEGMRRARLAREVLAARSTRGLITKIGG